MGVGPTRSRTAAPGSSRSPTSTRPPRSKRSSASTAASSAPRPTPRRVMTWAWERGEKLLMLPDQHLGRNTAFKMGVPLDEMVVWDPNEVWGGLTAGAGQDSAKLILWKGHCSVHTRFTVRADRGVPQEVSRQGKVVAHPECTLRRRPGGRRERIDRVHHQHREGQPGGQRLGGRDGGPPRQPARPRGRAGQDRRHARSVRLPVLDDVPRVAEPPALDSRGAGRGPDPQPDHRARRDEARREARARSHARNR